MFLICFTYLILYLINILIYKVSTCLVYWAPIINLLYSCVVEIECQTRLFIDKINKITISIRFWTGMLMVSKNRRLDKSTVKLDQNWLQIVRDITWLTHYISYIYTNRNIKWCIWWRRFLLHYREAKRRLENGSLVESHYYGNKPEIY